MTDTIRGTLPDCMMPDGADPCRGYVETHAKMLRYKAEIACLRAHRDEAMELLREWCKARPPGDTEWLRRFEKTADLLSRWGGSK